MACGVRWPCVLRIVTWSLILSVFSLARSLAGCDIAPEILRGEGYGKAVDWWSLGTLVYEMLVGLPPFYSQNVNLMYEKILKGELKFPSHISPEAKRLLLGVRSFCHSVRLVGWAAASQCMCG